MSTKNKSVRIGSGAGYSGDRIEPAVDLAKNGNIDYLIFECLAERTIALAQLDKKRDPAKGYDPLLEARMEAVLELCSRKKIKIITNMGAANPVAAMEKVAAIATKCGVSHIKIAAVTGDDVMAKIIDSDKPIIENGEKLSSIRDSIVSANAYLGFKPIVRALEEGADIIITGRVSDPALFIAPLVYEFGWEETNYELLGKATLAGHLLECAGQITGGYFSDPGYKDVPDIENLGFPIAEVDSKGGLVITKTNNSGGLLNTATCKEQMLYEIHDPKAYLTPDVIADFSNVRFREIGQNMVEATGATGREKSGMLKVSVGHKDGFIGEGQISYGGPGAVERAKLAIDIVKKRLHIIGLKFRESKFDIIGLNSLYGEVVKGDVPCEVRVRIAVKTDTLSEAVRAGNEVETLYTNGPAGGGGVTKSTREIIAVKSILIDESVIEYKNYYTSVN